MTRLWHYFFLELLLLHWLVPEGRHPGRALTLTESFPILDNWTYECIDLQRGVEVSR